MSPGHDHPVDSERVAVAKHAVLSEPEAGRLAGLLGLVSFRRDGRLMYYRLRDGFPHQLLEHCLRQLLVIAGEEGGRAGS